MILAIIIYIEIIEMQLNGYVFRKRDKKHNHRVTPAFLCLSHGALAGH